MGPTKSSAAVTRRKYVGNAAGIGLTTTAWILAVAGGATAAEPSGALLDEIRAEATSQSRSTAGRPLPLAAHWNANGAQGQGFSPEYQLRLLSEGRHILPWLEWPPTDAGLDHNFKPGDPRRQKYIEDRLKVYEPVVRELARLKLPISLLATQWESVLSYETAFYDLPPDKNPNVVGADGKVQRRVCPFGPVAPWRDAGRSWTDNLFMKQLQTWYPDPPLVLLISNNEHGKLQWNEAETNPRYLAKYGRGQSDDFKRKVVGDGWIERYDALLEGVRSGLVSDSWRKNSKCVGYEAFGPVHFGRWSGWKQYSLYSPARIDPFPVCWDGGSPSYYLHNWMAITDYTVWSPQIESMNWVFMLDEVHRTRPEFWFELSTWDGDQPGAGNDKRKFYVRQGQPFSPARYEGFVQFGMWLTRPRAVREFRGYLETVEYAGAYFDAVLDSVDRVHRHPLLQKFWRNGTLVPNPRGKHPYQADVPAEYAGLDRWFLLHTDLTPGELQPEEFDNAAPPARQLEVPVFALALALGTAPQREWLLYAHAPREARTGVHIELPGYGPVVVDVPQSGSFFLVTEADKQVRPIHKGGPASLHVEAPQTADVDMPVTFAASEKFDPAGSLDAVRWEFGDGGSQTGERLEHRFQKAGQYRVTAVGLQGQQEVARREVPVFVGLKPDQAEVCRLLMKGALGEGLKSWIWLSGWDKVDYHFIPDASGRGNLGFLAGGSWVHDDQRGTVLELDGKHDRIEISNSPDINTAAYLPQRTIAFWFRAAGEAPQDPLDALDAKAKRAPVVPQVLYEEGGSGAGINVYLNGETLLAGTWGPGAEAWVQTNSENWNRWHHMALVLSAASDGAPELTQALYLDGRQVAEGKGPRMGPHVGDINLGRSGNTRLAGKAADQPGFYFAGRLDDFRILNRALSAAEIARLGKTETGK